MDNEINLLEIIGALFGLVYLYLEWRASIWLWLAGVVMPAIYIVVYYRAGLYADFGINVYYLLAAAYGLWRWRTVSNEQPAKIIHTPARLWWRMAAMAIVLFCVIAFILVQFTDSTVPYADSFTTSLSIIALWQLANKHVEQWLTWIVVDAACVGLYIYKDLHATAILYAIYTIVAIFGYRKWLQLMKNQS